MSSAYSSANLKKSSLYFLSGKVVSGGLTFVILILLARLLENSAYGAYVTLIAILELGFALGNLGMGWVGHRYIPEYRLHASSKDLGVLIASILSARTLALTVVAVVVFLFEGLLAHYLHLEEFNAAIYIYSFVLVIEGAGRAIRDDIFAALLQQKTAQFILILRNIALLFLLLNGSDGSLDLTDFAWMELYVSIMAAAFSLLSLIHYLIKLKLTRQPDWKAPKFKQFVRTARAMYASFLLTMAAGQQVFLFLINALLGLEAAAVFGFASNLINMLKGYLPAELLMGLIQPKLVADYTLHKDMNRLSNNSLFAWKLSLVVLIPAVSFFIIYGESFSSIISTGNFSSAGPIMAGLAISLIPFSQHRILETIANILGHPEACVMASFMSLLSLPLVIILISQGFGLWAVIIALIMAEILFNVTLSFRVKLLGCPYGLDLSVLSRLTMLVAAVTFSLWLFMALPGQAWAQALITDQIWLQQVQNLLISEIWIPQILAVFLATIVTAILGWDIGFFSPAERRGVLDFFKAKLK